jgi:hypothetical protein
MWWAAVVAMTVAVLTKMSAALMAPLLMVAILRAQTGVERRVAICAGAALLAVGLVLLFYLPFWPPWESVRGVLAEYADRYSYTPAALARMLLREVIPAKTARAVPRALGRIIFLGFYGWQIVRLWMGRVRLAEAGFSAYFAYLLTGASYRIWYPLWLVPLAVLSLSERTSLRTFLFSLTSELSILMYYLVWRWLIRAHVAPESYWVLMHGLTVPWQYGLPLLAPLLVRSQPQESTQ